MSFDNKILKSLIKQYFTSFDYAVDLITQLALKQPDIKESMEVMQLADKIKNEEGKYEIDLVDISGIPLTDVSDFVQKYNEENAVYVTLDNGLMIKDNEKSETLFAISIQPIDARYEAVLVPTKLRSVFDDFIEEYRQHEFERDLSREKEEEPGFYDIEITPPHELEENKPAPASPNIDDQPDENTPAYNVIEENETPKKKKEKEKKQTPDNNTKIREEQERINAQMREQRERKEIELKEQRQIVESALASEQKKEEKRREENQNRTEPERYGEQQRTESQKPEEHSTNPKTNYEEKRQAEYRTPASAKAERDFQDTVRRAEADYHRERKKAEENYHKTTSESELQYAKKTSSPIKEKPHVDSVKYEKYKETIHTAVKESFSEDLSHKNSSNYTTFNKNISPMQSFSQEKMILKQEEYTKVLDAERYTKVAYNSYAHKCYNMSSVGMFETAPFTAPSSTTNIAKPLVETNAQFLASHNPVSTPSTLGSSSAKFLEKQGELPKAVLRESYRQAVDQATGAGTFQRVMEIRQMLKVSTLTIPLAASGSGSQGHEKLINSTLSDMRKSRSYIELNDSVKGVGLKPIAFDDIKQFNKSFSELQKLIESSLNQHDVYKIMDMLHVDYEIAERLAAKYQTLVSQNRIITNHIKNKKYAAQMKNRAIGQMTTLVTMAMRNLFKDNEGATYLIGVTSLSIQGLKILATPAGNKFVKTVAKPITILAKKGSKYVERKVVPTVINSAPYKTVMNSAPVQSLRGATQTLSNGIHTFANHSTDLLKGFAKKGQSIATEIGTEVIKNAEKAGSKLVAPLLKIKNNNNVVKMKTPTRIKTGNPLLKKAQPKVNKQSKKAAEKVQRKLLSEIFAEQFTRITNFFGNVKLAIIIVFVGGFLLAYIILAIGMLLASLLLFIFSAFEYDGSNSSKYIMEEVYTALCKTEADWVDNFVSLGTFEDDTDINSLRYTVDSKEIGDYCVEQNWTLYSDGIKGPQPFTGAPEEAYKHIQTIDGGSEFTFANGYGATTQTSNIKDILCMSTVYFEQSQDTLNEEVESNRFLSLITNLKSKINNFKKNMRDKWNNIVSGMDFLKMGTVGDEVEQSKIEQLYTQVLFTYSHTETIELKMVKLPIGTEAGTEGNEDNAPNGLLTVCPYSESFGCKRYDDFYYLDDGSISGDGATSAEGCGITSLDDNCALLQSDEEKAASPCWDAEVTVTPSSEDDTDTDSGTLNTQQTTVTYTHNCKGGHVGRYCGGHLQLYSTGIVYSITEEQLSELPGTIISKVPEPATPLPVIQDDIFVSVNEEALKRAHDIFDVDSALSHSVQRDTWVGWDSSNMEWTVVLFNQDWEDIYDLPLGRILGSGGGSNGVGGSNFAAGNNGSKRGIPLSEAEIIAYMSDIIGKSITAADLRAILDGTYQSTSVPLHNLQACAHAFGWVGKIGYGQTPGHDWELKEGGLTDCSGFASRCWMYTSHNYGILTSAGYYSKSVPLSGANCTAGDIFVRKGHVMLFVGMSPDGKYRFCESNIAPGGGKQGPGNVYFRECSLSWLVAQGYQLVKMP